MNFSSASRRASAEDQAALWAARLEGASLSADDRDALDTWLAAHPGHRALLSQYCQFSADLEEQLLTLVASGAVELPAEKAPVRRRRASLWIFSTALAAAAAVACGLWITQPPSQHQTVATTVAQRQSLTLADGTQVDLNAHTSLQVDIDRHTRHVHLAGGEAFFTVSKDKSRPFIIETPAGSVRVTGTVFNVRTETASDLEVTVVEGSVQVRPISTSPTAAPYALVANDCLTAIDGRVTKSSLSASDLEDSLAWRQGRMWFKGVPMPEALARVGRYHGREISCSSALAAATDLKIGGLYGIDDFNEFLSSLEKTFPTVKVTPSSTGSVRVSLRSEP